MFKEKKCYITWQSDKHWEILVYNNVLVFYDFRWQSTGKLISYEICAKSANNLQGTHWSISRSLYPFLLLMNELFTI